MISIQNSSSIPLLRDKLSKESSITELPSDLLAKILSNLGKQGKDTRLVCKKFNLTFCQSVKSLKLTDQLKEKELQLVTPELYENLQNIEIRVTSWLNKKQITNVPPYRNLRDLMMIGVKLPMNFLSTLDLPMLQNIKLFSRGFELDGKGILRFLKSSPLLLHLELSEIVFNDLLSNDDQNHHKKLIRFIMNSPKGKVDQNLSKILSVTSKVEFLEISFSKDLNGDCLQNLSSSLPTLKKLRIISNENLDPSKLSRLSGPNFANLNDLYLCDGHVNDLAVSKILKLSPHLEDLSLSTSKVSGSVFNDEFLNLNHLQSLRILDFQGNSDFLSENLGYIFNKSLNLNSFSIHSGIKSGFGSFRNCLSNLNHLDLSENNDMNDQALDQITLRARNLINVGLHDCLNLTEAALSKLIERCPKIETLDLGGCEMDPNGPLGNIRLNPPLLKSLNLYGLNLTRIGLDHISRFSNLKDLDIDYADLTKSDIIEKLPLLINLEEVVLPEAVDDEVLLALANRMPNLTTIRLTNRDDMRKETRSGVEAAVKCAQDMGRKLYISY